MSKNIRHALRTIVFDAFREGQQKHQERDPGKIYAYGTKFQLLDRIDDLTKGLPKEIRRPQDIKKEDIIRYLDYKAKKGCTQATLDEYRAECKKLGILAGIDLSVSRVIADKPKALDRGAQDIISAAEFTKILDYAQSHPSKSGLCILLEKEIGVRVSDLAYGIEIKGDTLRIRSKNGKYCYRQITPKVKELLKVAKVQGMIKDKKLLAPKDNSINKYLGRVQDKLGLERHSFHSLRRRIAQDKYDELRTSGVTRSEALSLVSQWLNHGEKREEMILRSYIANAW